MTHADAPLDFLWFIPSSGDGAYLGTDFLNRPNDPDYHMQIAQAADRLGYSGVLIPTGAACEESFVLASYLAAGTTRLKFLVAVRPGTASPAYYARLAATLDRVSRGRLLLNIVVGGNPQELAGDGIFLPHDGIVAEVRLRPDAPLSPLGSGHAFNLGSAECIEAVHECYADLDLGGLAIRVA